MRSPPASAHTTGRPIRAQTHAHAQKTQRCRTPVKVESERRTVRARERERKKKTKKRRHSMTGGHVLAQRQTRRHTPEASIDPSPLGPFVSFYATAPSGGHLKVKCLTESGAKDTNTTSDECQAVFETRQQGRKRERPSPPPPKYRKRQYTYMHTHTHTHVPVAFSQGWMNGVASSRKAGPLQNDEHLFGDRLHHRW